MLETLWQSHLEKLQQTTDDFTPARCGTDMASSIIEGDVRRAVKQMRRNMAGELPQDSRYSKMWRLHGVILLVRKNQLLHEGFRRAFNSFNT